MRRRRAHADRTTIAVAAGAGTWVAVGGQVGAAAGLLVLAAVRFPSLLSNLRPGSSGDSRPAVAALAGAAAVVAVAGPEHLTSMMLFAGLSAAVVWAWPLLRRGAHRARPSSARRSSTGANVKGNHHGRVDAIEEVPSGRVGLSRKRGGDGPSQIVLCAKHSSAGKLVRVAERRYVNARWRVASQPQPCDIDKAKRHWRLRAVGPATRKG